MVPYKLRVSYINKDFTFDPMPEMPWMQTVEKNEDLVLILNRMAIATTQGGVSDPPLIEITQGSKRVSVEGLDGFLYYTDPASSNRRNVKVLAEEVVALIFGETVDFVLSKPEEDAAGAGATVRYAGSEKSPAFRWTLLALFCVVMTTCGYVIVKTLTDRPLLVPAPAFVPSDFGEKALLPQLDGVYVSEYREGGYVCRIRPKGAFELYEMWQWEGHDGFVLVLVEKLDMQEGLHYDMPAILAGEFRLIRPLANGDINMQGIVMERQTKNLEEIGEIMVRGQ